MGWPGGCSTKLLADIVIFSSYLILLISKHFTEHLSTEESLFFRSSCLFNEKSVCKQCTVMPKKPPKFSSLLQWSNQSKSRKGTQNNRRFQTRKWRHGGNFQGTKITCIWLQSINLKHCPFLLVNCRGEAAEEEDKTINTFSILKDCRQL